MEVVKLVHQTALPATPQAAWLAPRLLIYRTQFVYLIARMVPLLGRIRNVRTVTLPVPLALGLVLRSACHAMCLIRHIVFSLTELVLPTALLTAMRKILSKSSVWPVTALVSLALIL